MPVRELVEAVKRAEAPAGGPGAHFALDPTQRPGASGPPLWTQKQPGPAQKSVQAPAQ